MRRVRSRGLLWGYPTATVALLCLLAFPALCLAISFEAAGPADISTSFDFESVNQELYAKYHAKKMETFKQFEALNPDGTVNKAAKGYDAAVEEVQKHHKEMMESAKAWGEARDGMVKDQLGPAGKGLKISGTDPSKGGGRGTFGDFEGTLKPTDYDKAWKNVEGQPGWKRGPDYFTNEQSGAVIHRGPGVGDVSGSSAADARINAQAGTEAGETLGSAGSQKAYQKPSESASNAEAKGYEKLGGAASEADPKGKALDAARKGDEAWTTQPRTPYEASKQQQQIAKAANNMNEAAGLKPDPNLKAVKEGMDPDLIKDLGSVKETAQGQMQSAWQKAKELDAKNLADLDQRISQTTDPKEAVALKAEKQNIIARQNKTLETLTGPDGGKALTEMTGETPGTIKGEIGSTRPPELPGGTGKAPGPAPEGLAGKVVKGGGGGEVSTPTPLKGAPEGGAAAETGVIKGAGATEGGGSSVLSKLGPVAKWGLLIYGIYQSGHNILNHPEGIVEGAKEEAGGWGGGIVGGILGGGLVAGPVGAIIGGIAGTVIGVLSTSKGFADWLFGNDQATQNLKGLLETAGKSSPKAFEKGMENLDKSGGLANLFQPPPEQAAGTATIGGGGDRVSDLKGKEAQGAAPAGAGDTGSNPGQSYWERQKEKKAREQNRTQRTDGTKTGERVESSEAQNNLKNAKIAGQGLETDGAIEGQGQAFDGAQANADAARSTGIGAIAAAGLMGGLTMGVATGLDGFFGTLGQGLGAKASAKWGIVPKPDHDGGTGHVGADSSGASGPGKDKPSGPTTYSCQVSGTVRAVSGLGWSTACSYHGTGSLTLSPDGSVHGTSNAAFHIGFTAEGGPSCGSASSSGSVDGRHGGGSVSFRNSSGSAFQGSYTPTSLDASGGRTGSSMQLVSDDGKTTITVTTDITTEFSCAAAASSAPVRPTAPANGGIIKDGL